MQVPRFHVFVADLVAQEAVQRHPSELVTVPLRRAQCVQPRAVYAVPASVSRGRFKFAAHGVRYVRPIRWSFGSRRLHLRVSAETASHHHGGAAGASAPERFPHVADSNLVGKVQGSLWSSHWSNWIRSDRPPHGHSERGRIVYYFSWALRFNCNSPLTTRYHLSCDLINQASPQAGISELREPRLAAELS